MWIAPCKPIGQRLPPLLVFTLGSRDSVVVITPGQLDLLGVAGSMINHCSIESFACIGDFAVVSPSTEEAGLRRCEILPDGTRVLGDVLRGERRSLGTLSELVQRCRMRRHHRGEHTGVASQRRSDAIVAALSLRLSFLTLVPSGLVSLDP